MEVYNLLAKMGLDNESTIEKKIKHDMSLDEIFKLNEEINSKIEPVKVRNEELPNYNFAINGELGGQDYGGCSGIDCRLERVNELNRFASLWADKVYIHSYFDKHKIMSEGEQASKDPRAEASFRESYAGHLKCFNKLKPLVEKGIVEVIGGHGVCPTCYAEKTYEIDDIRDVLSKHVEELAGRYRENIHGVLLRDKESEELGLYTVALKVPEDIDRHGEAMWLGPRIPKRLEKKLITGGKEIVLSKRELKEIRIPESRIMQLVNSVLFSQVLAKAHGLDTSFCTNSHLEVKLMNYISNSEKDIDRNQVLQRELACELPILTGIPLEYLLEIREKNHEAFLVYRDAIKAVINDYLSQDLNNEEVKELYGDVILPKINSLNSEIKVIKERARRNLRLDIIVLVTFGTFGLLSNTLTAQIPFLAASGLSALEIARNIYNSIGTPDKIKRNDFYFLWKLSRKEMKGRTIK